MQKRFLMIAAAVLFSAAFLNAPGKDSMSRTCKRSSVTAKVY